MLFKSSLQYSECKTSMNGENITERLLSEYRGGTSLWITLSFHSLVSSPFCYGPSQHEGKGESCMILTCEVRFAIDFCSRKIYLTSLLTLHNLRATYQMKSGCNPDSCDKVLWKSWRVTQ